MRDPDQTDTGSIDRMAFMHPRRRKSGAVTGNAMGTAGVDSKVPGDAGYAIARRAQRTASTTHLSDALRAGRAEWLGNDSRRQSPDRCHVSHELWRMSIFRYASARNRRIIFARQGVLVCGGKRLLGSG